MMDVYVWSFAIRFLRIEVEIRTWCCSLRDSMENKKGRWGRVSRTEYQLNATDCVDTLPHSKHCRTRIKYLPIPVFNTKIKELSEGSCPVRMEAMAKHDHPARRQSTPLEDSTGNRKQEKYFVVLE